MNLLVKLYFTSKNWGYNGDTIGMQYIIYIYIYICGYGICVNIMDEYGDSDTSNNCGGTLGIYPIQQRNNEYECFEVVP